MVFDDSKPDIPDIVFPIDDALQRATGFRPGIALEEGLRTIVSVS